MATILAPPTPPRNPTTVTQRARRECLPLHISRTPLCTRTGTRELTGHISLISTWPQAGNDWWHTARHALGPMLPQSRHSSGRLSGRAAGMVTPGPGWPWRCLARVAPRCPARCRPPAAGPGQWCRRLRARWVRGRGRAALVLGAGWFEDLGPDPGEGFVQDRAQVAEGVFADGAGVRGQAAQLGGELQGQAFQVAELGRVGPDVAELGRVGPAGSAAGAWPVVTTGHVPPAGPVFQAGPVAPARPVTQAGPVGPVLLGPAAPSAEAGAGLLVVFARLAGRPEGATFQAGRRALRVGSTPTEPPLPLGTFALMLCVFLGLFAGLPGFLAGAPGLAAGLFGGAAGLVADPLEVILRPPALAVHVPGGAGYFLAQAADGLPDVFLHLAGDVPHGFGDLFLELGQVVHPFADLGAALLGQPVDLLAFYLVVGDQALFFQAGQPGVDGAGGGSVHTHETVLQQPDDLIAMLGGIVQQLEQVEPQPAVTEHRAHRASPSSVEPPMPMVAASSVRSSARDPAGSPGSPPSNRSSGVSLRLRRRIVTSPDMLLTVSLPDPVPSVPARDFVPALMDGFSASKSLCIRPDLVRRSTRASVPTGSRSATSPDSVLTFISPAGPSATSAVSPPPMVFASRPPMQPSARVRSPDTEWKTTWPFRSCASTFPETVFTSTAPATPSSVMSPDTLLSDVLADTPDTTALALITPTWVGQSFCTM